MQLHLRMICPVILYEDLMLRCLLSLRWRSKYESVHRFLSTARKKKLFPI